MQKCFHWGSHQWRHLNVYLFQYFRKVWVRFAMSNKSQVDFFSFFLKSTTSPHCKCQLPWWWFSVTVTSKTPLLWKSHQTPCVRKQLAVPYHCSPQTHHTELNTRSTCSCPNPAVSPHLLTVLIPSELKCWRKWQQIKGKALMLLNPKRRQS